MAQELAKDFFISYTEPDRLWAEWVAWQLEEMQFTTVLQAWDFLPGANFVMEMDRATTTAKSTIALLSAAYLQGLYARSEWAAAFMQAPTGEKKKLIPVRVSECEITGLLAPIVYIDLVGLSEEIARAKLIQSVSVTRNKPAVAPAFPEVEKALLKMTGTPDFPGMNSALWNVPYRRNLFFTDRDETLRLLHDKFIQGRGTNSLLIQAIGGLGGIGKTQISIEYAYRYRDEYDCVLWARAASRDTLAADFVAIAGLLQLPEKNEQKQERVIEAVRQWLNVHMRWLLVLDNIDELELVHEFVPERGNGHVLLTTHTQAMSGLAKKIGVEIMTPEEGALFLLRRANIIEPDAELERVSETERAEAITISELLHGLPLALDQAGAYIEETASSLGDYIALYTTQRAALLSERGGFAPEHPEPVTTTWALSFEKLSKTSQAAVELLRFLAFLHPDIIPEDILTMGAPELGPILEPVVSNSLGLNAAIKELLRYSLIRRNPGAKTLTIHRLVQFVLKDEMDEEMQREWAMRTVRAVNRAFPEVEFTKWAQCQRVLTHAEVCASLIQQWGIRSVEAARLLYRAGYYLRERGQYRDAEPFLQQSLNIYEQMEHPDIVDSLSGLAVLYHDQGKYDLAKSLLQRTLALLEQRLGSQHPRIAATLDNLALLDDAQKNYEQAELFSQRALAMREQMLGQKHADIATNLNNLAGIYIHQRNYDQAMPLLERALAIREETLGSNHPRLATTLNNLASIYIGQKNYTPAEKLLQRALKIREQTLGPQHPQVITSLMNLGQLYQEQQNYGQAEIFYLRIVALYEANKDSRSSIVIHSLIGLATIYCDQGEYNKVQSVYQRALAIIDGKEIDLQNYDIICLLESYEVYLQQEGQVEEAQEVRYRIQTLQTKVE